jgi:diguanylate cyclase (GGDEF)-like protein
MPVREAPARRLEELEEKLLRQNQAIDSYREELKKAADAQSERDLYCELSTVFARASNFDDVFKKTLEALSRHLKVRYFGVFWLDPESSGLVYRHGRGYKPGLMSAIPFAGSLMGECLYRREVVWEQQFNQRKDVIPLNQDPAEYNVLCAPIVLLDNDAGVVRLANIDPATAEKARPIMETVSQLLCSSLERLLLHERNERSLRGLEASFSIARLLENTLNKQEILKRVCSEVPRLFGCAGCIIAMRDQTGTMKPVLAWPEGFVLSGNQGSANIYLRNLVEAFPAGNGVIANMHRDERRWSWPDPKVKSLCLAPIRIRNILQGVIIAVGPAEETYEKSQVNLLGIVAAQTAMTLERASYFQQQEDLARCDGLTGLFNHRMFQETIREEIGRAQRYSRALALIILDIDFFKKFNDAYGHPAGDEVIKMVARSAKSMIRATDRAFRYGGEEFAVLLPETTAENTVHLAERLRHKIAENRTVRNLTVTISSGVTGYIDGETPEEFINRADAALYAAKEGGRNRVVVG